MKILIDNGHGENTRGKRSPDGVLVEYQYTREIAEAVKRELCMRGYDAERIVRESLDVPLSERVRRVNEWCSELGAANVLLVSIHCNAAGNGEEWMEARGWSAYTCKGKTKSDKLADALYAAAERNFCSDGVAAYGGDDSLAATVSQLTVRRDMSDGDADWEENFYMLKHTRCAAVLTENFFMDNPDDMAYLLSREGREAVVRTHVEGIVNYVKSLGV